MIKIRYDWLNYIEKQLNHQGFTLGDNSKRYEEYRMALLGLFFDGILTGKEFEKITNRITKNISKEVKPLSKKGGAE